MRKTLIIFCLLFPWISFSQDYSNAWEAYFSFFKIKDIDAAGDFIFTASENALFSTDLGSLEQEEITTLTGLSGDEISSVSYASQQNIMLIGYDSGLLQIYNPSTKKTRTFIDILQQPTITPEERMINEFFIDGDKAYLSTNYGISTFNLNKLEFGDTYYIGNNGDKLGVNSISIQNDQIFAATKDGGLRYASLNNPSLVDYNQWNQVEQGEIQRVFNFYGELYILQNNILKRWENNQFNQIINFGQTVNDIKLSQNTFSVTMKNNVRVYDENLSQITYFSTVEFDGEFNTALAYKGFLYVGDNNFGLVRAPLSNPNALEYFSPNGPLRNDIFSMDLTLSQLWVSYGEYTFSYNPYPLTERGISHYSEEHWVNIPYEDLPENRSITSVKINPFAPEQVFFASFRDGLMEVNQNEVVNFYTTNNSNLEPIETASSSPDAIRLGPMDFDPSGNLWMASSLHSKGLISFKPGGNPNSFKKYNLTSVIPQPTSNNGFGALVTDQSGNVYMGAYKEGIIGFHAGTKKFAKIKGGSGSGNLPSNDVRALAIDLNNQLWIGTGQGLRVLYGPSQMFENPNTKVNNIVFLDNDGVAQELFANLSITSIAVDGNNNKWVGSTSGVYQVSSDGQKTIHHFTTDNSPLPSNNIVDIKIDGSTGKVFMATQKGLVAFRGNSTSAQNNLDKVRAYPNPVRPGYDGVVTVDGLMKNANVKITDIEGNLVYEEVSRGGSIQWDTRAFGKYKVASGVYMVLITSEDQAKTKVAKIMIIR